MTNTDLVSADSHVVEPPEVFGDFLTDSRWRSQAPRLAEDGDGGQCYVIQGSTRVIGLGLTGSAGEATDGLRVTGTRFADLRPGAWQPAARLSDQDLDGVSAEVLYPTVGLFLLGHVNREFAAACSAAYNAWISQFCAHAPRRLLGCGMSAAATPEAACADLRAIRRAGLRAALLPTAPATGQFHDKEYDAVWATAAELGLPVVFHAQPPARPARAAGPAEAAMVPLWDVQELLTGLIVGGVLHRRPRLRLVFAEFDAGWVPYLVQRLDHFFHQNYRWLRLDNLIDRPPSEYVGESVFFTFQDDPLGVRLAGSMKLNLMWGSDFPHAESTWPTSRSIASSHRDSLSAGEHADIFARNAAQLYGMR